MKTRVCRLYGVNDIRVETQNVEPPGPEQVLVRIAAGGICGSDLHYYQDGGFGPIRVREPIILGHEVAGTVEKVGANVDHIAPGDQVALNPSQPCHNCKRCAEGIFQHCLNMRFYGSAMRFPHEQGAFRDLIVAQASQCEAINPDVSLAEAACCEPLAVCLHARNRTGSLKGKRVLVTGAGPIGSLCVAAAHQAGAAQIVVTDLQDRTLEAAMQMGATQSINVADNSAALEAFFEDRGTFDVAFECSAAPVALKTAISAIRPQGTIVQVGVTGDIAIPLNLLVGKEITLKGTHRFHAEFAEAADLLNTGQIDVKPIVTASYPLAQARDAFEEAGDRSRAVKVQLTFA
tara:strand:- start:108684 stop:109724 length:1041 start_codon:yes stop_codon:yes gene_type:complete